MTTLMDGLLLLALAVAVGVVMGVFLGIPIGMYLEWRSCRRYSKVGDI